MRTQSSKSRDKVRAHREHLRRRGPRPIQIWVPDVGSLRFAREAHRQSLLVARSSGARRRRESRYGIKTAEEIAPGLKPKFPVFTKEELLADMEYGGTLLARAVINVNVAFQELGKR